MPQKKLDDPVSTHELAVSNMVSVEALVGLLIKKGLITLEEILEEVQVVRADMLKKAGRPAASSDRDPCGSTVAM